MEYFELLIGGPLTWGYPLVAALSCIAVLYAFLIKRYTQVTLTHMQPLLFFFGLGLLYVTVGSPLSDISHLSFSLHMIQMSILYFLIPPSFLLGIPDQLFNRVFEILQLNRISKLFLAPKIALYAFSTLFLVYHLPVVLNALSQSSFIQNGYFLLLFVLSFGMWSPIASPDSNQRLCRKEMKRYASLSGLIIMPACILFILTAFIDSGNNPLLNQITSQLCTPAQAGSFSLLPPPFNTTFDQLMAGIFMLVLHKLGLMLTLRLGDKYRPRPLTSQINIRH